MKVLVKSYAVNNLGDDLFIKILCERYKNHEFTVITPFYNGCFYGIDNLHLVKNKILFYLDKVLKKFIFKYSLVEMLLKKRNDILVFIGGSIFIQNSNIETFKKSCVFYEKNYIPYYILGCNVGPFYSDDYVNVLKNDIYKNAENVSFRDSYSYSLFKDMMNTHLYPDIVLGLNFKNDIKIEKKVVISVIDVKRKMGLETANIYEQKIIELISLLKDKDYSITLMSFCKSEGDEIAINRILANCPYKLNKYFYRGNIDEALEEIASSSIIVGSRFHANILGLVFNKTIIPFSYSEKTDNMLKDLKYNGKIIDIKRIEEFDVTTITENDLVYKINIDSYRKEAFNHFHSLDKVLGCDKCE